MFFLLYLRCSIKQQKKTTLKFYLNKPKSKEKTSILFRLSYGAYEIVNGGKKYSNFRYFTSESIDPAYWNPKTGRAKETKKYPQFPEFNARLQSIEDTTLNILRRLQNDDITPNNEILKVELDKVFKDVKNVSKVDISGYNFVEFARHYIVVPEQPFIYLFFNKIISKKVALFYKN